VLANQCVFTSTGLCTLFLGIIHCLGALKKQFQPFHWNCCPPGVGKLIVYTTHSTFLPLTFTHRFYLFAAAKRVVHAGIVVLAALAASVPLALLPRLPLHEHGWTLLSREMLMPYEQCALPSIWQKGWGPFLVDAICLPPGRKKGVPVW
jgi:hypothetical protein